MIKQLWNAYLCASFLLVAQPLVFYAKRFIRIASHCEDMAKCFAIINCRNQIGYRLAACKAQCKALEIATSRGPGDRVQCLKKSMELAATMRNNKAIYYASCVLDEAIRHMESLNVDSTDPEENIKETKEILEQYMEALKLEHARVYPILTTAFLEIQYPQGGRT